MKTLVVNLFGGAGTGKSTTASGVFSNLKLSGINCELVTEYAKELTWDENWTRRNNQLSIFGEQQYRIDRLVSKVDVIITDAPLFNSLFYNDQKYKKFEPLVLEVFKSYNNLNVVLNRVKKYNPNGRTQTEEQAKMDDQSIRNLLDFWEVPYLTFNGNSEAVFCTTQFIKQKIGEEHS